MWRSQVFGGLVLQLHHFRTYNFHTGRATPSNTVQKCWQKSPHRFGACPTPFCQSILAEGAIALSVTLSGGVLFASWNYCNSRQVLSSRSFLQFLPAQQIYYCSQIYAQKLWLLQQQNATKSDAKSYAATHRKQKHLSNTAGNVHVHAQRPILRFHTHAIQIIVLIPYHKIWKQACKELCLHALLCSFLCFKFLVRNSLSGFPIRKKKSEKPFLAFLLPVPVFICVFPVLPSYQWNNNLILHALYKPQHL